MAPLDKTLLKAGSNVKFLESSLNNFIPASPTVLKRCDSVTIWNHEALLSMVEIPYDKKKKNQ
jgi:hypothetical protein